MRISDWSSDVCSSDLVGRGVLAPARDRARRRAWHGGGAPAPARCPSVRLCAAASGRMVRADRLPAHHGAQSRGRARADRKSVVEGKSVSVRVDLGGRRIIKKKQTKKQIDKRNE